MCMCVFFELGILVVVAIGVALGVFIGGTLLTIVAFCMKRSVISSIILCLKIKGNR